MATSSYLFNHNENIKYNDQLDHAVIGYPIHTSINWHSLPADFQSDIDDVINVNDYLYFFKGDRYLKFSLIREMVVEGPSPISHGWPGLVGTGFETGINAAVEWLNPDNKSIINTVIFTKGSNCILYDITNNSIKKTDIATQFAAKAYPEFCSDLDTIFLWKSINASHAYLMKGERYIRYNLSKNAIDFGPIIITKFWHGVSFTQIKASVSIENDIMGSCCQCGTVENGRYDFQISPDTEFGLIAYANSKRQQTVSVYVDDQLVDVFMGKGDSNTVIGIRTYLSGGGNIGIQIQKEGAEPGRLNFCNNRLDSKARSITVGTQNDTDNGVPDCTVIINTPLS
ncbi:fucose-binding lectin II [Brucella intermedia]|uniref:fucose-binding lectin II n=1 Tax=Brucella intermedia TaxID=94625 RepID=UPI0023610A8F|nr:fucose-binding lectin II [Brucella intermedia]